MAELNIPCRTCVKTKGRTWTSRRGLAEVTAIQLDREVDRYASEAMA